MYIYILTASMEKRRIKIMTKTVLKSLLLGSKINQWNPCNLWLKNVRQKAKGKRRNANEQRGF